MNYRAMAMVVVCGAMLFATGCSATGALTTGGSMAMNLGRSDTYLRVWLDDQKAEQNLAKKAARGYSEWKTGEPVSTSPKLKFEITKPEKLGRITMVSLSIFQQFKADYSHQADFTVFCKENGSENQMKPGVDYDLGKPGEKLSTIDLEGKTIDGVKLDPGKKYKLVLTVKADKSETAQVEFKTK